jgi:hypothetical protein
LLLVPCDSFEEDVERVAAAGRRACEAIEAASRALVVGRDARLAGAPLVEVVENLIGAGGRGLRLGASEAFIAYEQALNAMRAGVVRALVEIAGLSLTDVASKMRISRQSAAKLYERARQGDQDSALATQ